MRLSEITGKRRRPGPITRVPVIDPNRGFWDRASRFLKQHPDTPNFTTEQLWNLTTRRLAAYAGVPEEDLAALMTSSLGADIAVFMQGEVTDNPEAKPLDAIVDRAIRATFDSPEDAAGYIRRKKRSYEQRRAEERGELDDYLLRQLGVI